uniref:Uncharacterized protein n=1 Tax=Steinernema glaseri TaxID=37863 RepID=A0A1I7YL60_9BILA
MEADKPGVITIECEAPESSRSPQRGSLGGPSGASTSVAVGPRRRSLPGTVIPAAAGTAQTSSTFGDNKQCSELPMTFGGRRRRTMASRKARKHPNVAQLPKQEAASRPWEDKQEGTIGRLRRSSAGDIIARRPSGARNAPPRSISAEIRAGF